jgi:hypothetical protein
MKKSFLLFIFIFSLPVLYAAQTLEELAYALEAVALIDKKINERFPLTFNHLFTTGYFVTHSARMTEAGSLGLGVAYAPPYFNWNGRIQPLSHLELSANYRIFLNYEDPLLGPHGFGNYADRGANFKFAFFSPDESLYILPGIAFGIDDFMGSKKFTTYYLVMTKVFREWGLEVSGGWGAGLYTKGPSRGFFAGFSWFPFWQCTPSLFRGVGFSAEYDPINYRKDPHPEGHVSKTPINFGIKYSIGNVFEFSTGYLRGKELAINGSLRYSWGSICGFLPKINDPLPYVSPVNINPLGCRRNLEDTLQQLDEALKEQGFRLLKGMIYEPNELGGYQLWLKVINCCYRQERIVRLRLESLLAAFTPINISQVIIILESEGLPCQQYCFDRRLLERYLCHTISPYEFDILSPRENVSPHPCQAKNVFYRQNKRWCGRISPRLETFFGSAKGKFKYDFGFKGWSEGFLPGDILYELQLSYTLLSTIEKLNDFDFIHPSQLLHVATDYIRYRQKNSFYCDALYLQKNHNFGKGLFGRISGGYFQVNYAGVAGELLWYPAQSCLAFGLEGAVVKKRQYDGLGFQSKLRKFQGRTPVFVPYFTLQQYFLSLYLDFPAFYFFTKLSVGQFLARDKGFRAEVTRYFENGLRLTGWMTFTNGADVMHGERYFDRGISLELPLDLFFKRSSRRVWNYGMAAWLRDAGYATSTGRGLFNIVNRERRW